MAPLSQIARDKAGPAMLLTPRLVALPLSGLLIVGVWLPSGPVVGRP